MERLDMITISIFILIEITSVCYGCICCLPDKNGKPMEQPDNVLPLWLTIWASPSPKYPLEFADDANFETDNKLTRYDQYAQDKAGDVALNIIKNRVNTYFEEHETFDITKLDAIEYEYENKKMFLILKNLKFYNLDKYNQNNAFYEQKAYNQYGDYIPPPEMLSKIKNNAKFKDRIRQKVKDGPWYLRRKDVVWNITMKADLFTETSVDETPIVLETDFKIQPRNPQEDRDLGMQGSLRIKLYKFSFKLEFAIKHIEDALRKYFSTAAKSNNRVSDFNLEYDMRQIEIVHIVLEKYDGYEHIEELPLQEKEEVNDGVPLRRSSFKKGTPPKKIFIEDKDGLKENTVREHLNVVIQQVLNERDQIRQRLCVNLMIKKVWKELKMKTKLELPMIILDVVRFDENFQRKWKSSPIQLSIPEQAAMGLDFMKAQFGFSVGDVTEGISNMAGNVIGWFSKSNTNDEAVEKNRIYAETNNNMVKVKS